MLKWPFVLYLFSSDLLSRRRLGEKSDDEAIFEFFGEGRNMMRQYSQSFITMTLNRTKWYGLHWGFSKAFFFLIRVTSWVEWTIFVLLRLLLNLKICFSIMCSFQITVKLYWKPLSSFSWNLFNVSLGCLPELLYKALSSIIFPASLRSFFKLLTKAFRTIFSFLKSFPKLFWESFEAKFLWEVLASLCGKFWQASLRSFGKLWQAFLGSFDNSPRISLANVWSSL